MNFKINKIGEIAFIHSINGCSPLDDLKEIKEELKNFKGTIIFDLMLVSGPYQRFYKTNLNFKNFEKIEDDSCRKVSCAFYKENEDLLDNSILTNQQKYNIIQGKMI